MAMRHGNMLLRPFGMCLKRAHAIEPTVPSKYVLHYGNHFVALRVHAECFDIQDKPNGVREVFEDMHSVCRFASSPYKLFKLDSLNGRNHTLSEGDASGGMEANPQSPRVPSTARNVSLTQHIENIIEDTIQ